MDKEKSFAWTLIAIVIVATLVLLFGCRVNVPTKNGYILSPAGFQHKNLVTSKEKKEYRIWRKAQIDSLKTK